MEKRGQAAMEFLMTYGWAILAAVITIGVLAYFGVFSPGKYVSGTTIVNPPFYANAFNIKDTGVTLELKNNGGEDYVIQSLEVTNCGTNDTLIPTPADMQAVITIPCSLTSGNTFKGDISINYRKSGSVVDLQSTGTVAGKVT